jgi:hypothetical protein
VTQLLTSVSLQAEALAGLALAAWRYLPTLYHLVASFAIVVYVLTPKRGAARTKQILFYFDDIQATLEEFQERSIWTGPLSRIISSSA